MIAISAVSFGILLSLPPIPNNHGWLIRQYDEVQYSVTRELHAGDTIVTKILNDYDIMNSAEFRVRPTDTPSTVNITAITEDILQLRGTVAVEQQYGNEWVLRNSSLPFFLPAGYWDDINSILNQTTGVALKNEWWGDMTITIPINSSELGVLECYFAWDKQNGVLQGMTINATSHGTWDFIRLSLSNERLAYETDINYILQAIEKRLPVATFSLGTVVPLLVPGFLWRVEIQERLHKPLQGSIEERLDEYGHTYLFLWMSGILITALASLVASQQIQESITPMYEAFGVAIALGIIVMVYKQRTIEEEPKPIEMMQYAFVSGGISVSVPILSDPENINSPFVYVIPLMFILTALVMLVGMYPLRGLRTTIDDEIMESQVSATEQSQ
ncbi:MAG: hypothetical protein K9W43_02760 [Candidatus Thorarchaeota archaeon]|nr:hypothetical protein [Candidatus Thorarchaeota archaeon]